MQRAKYISVLLALVALWSAAAPCRAADEGQPSRKTAGLFDRDNLVAWCIVPFDAARRSPEERAAMLQRLGLKRLAYDWRAEHVPSFEAEIAACRDAGIEFFAFWSWHPEFAPLVRKRGIRPQFWLTNPSPDGAADEDRVKLAADQLAPVVKQALELGCPVGLYNHGGWGGEPPHLVAVCRRLREMHQSEQIGIVYNFHHGHEHIEGFGESLQAMRPYLLCVNINGMNPGAEPKILDVGAGKHEADMLRVLAASGYDGPIGILDHRPETDSEETLRANLDGLERLVKKLETE